MNRFYTETTKEEDDAPIIKKCMNWLTDTNENILRVVYVPSPEQVRNTYLGRVIREARGDDYEFNASKNLVFSWNNVDVNVITNDNMDQSSEKARVFALWCDDESLPEIEKSYDVIDVLVLPWVPESDINGWKEKNDPTWIDFH